MKVSSISVNTVPHFTGEKTKKALKNTAGAAAIALAASVPSIDADAQYFVPVPPQYYYVPVTPAPVTAVPTCFVLGDMENYDTDKSMPQVFSEIDGKIKKNGSISLGEVIEMERDNWNRTNIFPYSGFMIKNTADQFTTLSTLYNEKNSDPKTINYSEYKNIMNSYMQFRNVSNFIGLLQILTMPHVCPPPPPPHHHPPHRPSRHHRH